MTPRVEGVTILSVIIVILKSLSILVEALRFAGSIRRNFLGFKASLTVSRGESGFVSMVSIYNSALSMVFYCLEGMLLLFERCPTALYIRKRYYDSYLVSIRIIKSVPDPPLVAFHILKSIFDYRLTAINFLDLLPENPKFGRLKVSEYSRSLGTR